VGPNDLWRGVHAFGQHLRRPAFIPVVCDRAGSDAMW
jgi:hypothetical protein